MFEYNYKDIFDLVEARQGLNNDLESVSPLAVVPTTTNGALYLTPSTATTASNPTSSDKSFPQSTGTGSSHATSCITLESARKLRDLGLHSREDQATRVSESALDASQAIGSHTLLMPFQSAMNANGPKDQFPMYDLKPSEVLKSQEIPSGSRTNQISDHMNLPDIREWSQPRSGPPHD